MLACALCTLRHACAPTNQRANALLNNRRAAHPRTSVADVACRRSDWNSRCGLLRWLADVACQA
eukprot:10592073-Alexandrium_andersonii.AAC.1